MSGALLESDRLAGAGGLIGRKDHPMRMQRGLEVGERHGRAGIKRVEERLKRGLARVIRDIAGIEHRHLQRLPDRPVFVEFPGVIFVIQKAALAATEMGVEVVGLKAVHHRRAFADLAASSASSCGREEQTAVTCACDEALMAGMCAEATQPYPMMPTL